MMTRRQELRVLYLDLQAAEREGHTGCGLSIRDLRAHPSDTSFNKAIRPCISATPYEPKGAIFIHTPIW